MTSDAKIGLLLGLIFIFMIAFIINGLPNFHKDQNNNELTTNMLGLQNEPLGLGTKERKVSRDVINWTEVVKLPSRTDNPNIRFETALPKSVSVIKKASTAKPVALVQPLSLQAAQKKQIRKIKAIKPTLPKVYIVSEGDNLAVIAKKFYGPEKGNKKINIARIFQANRERLKSPDEVYEGQKLIIPALSASDAAERRIENVLSTTEFTKVESIGARAPATNGSQIKQSKWYVVREGDNLWQIAAEQFGSAERYTELARLNADILDDQDTLVVGMRLKIPAR